MIVVSKEHQSFWNREQGWKDVVAVEWNGEDERDRENREREEISYESTESVFDNFI